MRQILFPTDFSPTADNAFVYALHLAQQLKAEIILFHAFNYTTAQALFAPADVLEEVNAVRHDTAYAQFQTYEKMAQEDPNMPIRLHPVVRQGFAADVILELCEEYQPYLVVMGTKGSSNFAHDILGSVTTTVLKSARFPVMGIPEHARFQGIHTIAYATDLQEKNLRDLYQLTQIARALEARAFAVHIATALPPGDAETHLREMEDRFSPGMEFDTVSLRVVAASSAAKGLDAFIEQENIDLLAIHPHQRTFFDELFRPSLTQQMALHARIPVLALHG